MKKILALLLCAASATAADVVLIEYGITLTNFVDTGFFRLRIPAP